MDISIFLSKSIGIYLVFISIVFVIREEKLKDLLLNMISNPALMLVSGFMELILGILMVVAHNIWVMDWRVLITIVGWSSLIKGMNILLFPEQMLNRSTKWIQNQFAYYAIFLFNFLLGSVLIYFGYIHSI